MRGHRKRLPSTQPDQAAQLPELPSKMRGTSGLAAAVLGVFCIGLMFRDAWMAEDAFITLRTVDNWVHGLGLTWNAGHRVQTYTHPLWMMLLAAGRAITGECYYTTLALSLGLSALALCLLVRWHGREPRSVLVVLLSLSASKSFVDFATSGLENPLTHVLVLAAYGILWERRSSPRWLLLLSLIVGFGALNRLDSILLLLPALVVGAWRARKAGAARCFGWILLGVSPVLAWSAFSLFYYGFIFPNTYYAKLPTEVGTLDFVRKGLKYLCATAIFDPLVFVLILAALGASFIPRGRHLLPASVGIVLWLAYLLRIGGDYMIGRHLTAPGVLAAAILVRFPFPSRALFAAGALVVLTGFGMPCSPWRTGRNYDFATVCERVGDIAVLHRLSDERARFYPTTGLLRPVRTQREVEHPWALQGMQWRPWFEKARRRPVLLGPVGMIAFYAGPNAHVVDLFALCDPLLARMPMRDSSKLVIGHYRREIPDGYLDTLFGRDNRLMDPDLARYWDRLSLVIAGELWSLDRLKAIWDLHCGRGATWIQDYRARRQG